MALLDEWLEYIDNPGKFDAHHFEGLMIELETPTLLHRALDPLPRGTEVADRIVAFRERADFNGTYLLPQLSGEDRHLARHLAETYRDRVADRLREIGDPEAILVGGGQIIEIEYQDYQNMKKARQLPLLNAPWTLEVHEKDTTRPFPRWKYGLREAVYMMTTFPEITRYLLWPMFRYPLDDTPAAELWLMGHRVDFCEDRTLLIIGGAG